MVVEIQNPKAVAEIEALMERLQIPASLVVERVIVEMGVWVPTENLAYPVEGELNPEGTVKYPR